MFGKARERVGKNLLNAFFRSALALSHFTSPDKGPNAGNGIKSARDQEHELRSCGLGFSKQSRFRTHGSEESESPKTGDESEYDCHMHPNLAFRRKFMSK